MGISLRVQYQCVDRSVCKPFEYNFDKGTYFVELWGASGGNISHGGIGGAGGYSSATFKFSESKIMYFFIGAAGTEGTAGLSENSFNGGGKGAYFSTLYIAASGGGATDVRYNSSLESRVLVAGGGSGAAYYDQIAENNGACGGGMNGRNGTSVTISGILHSMGEGGNQDTGGYGTQNGTFGYGGNQTEQITGSAGGGGWYGGGSGSRYATTGGGGSGYFHPSLQNASTISGCDLSPSFYNGDMAVGHYGDGGIRITHIMWGNYKCSAIILSLTFANLVIVSISLTTLI